jgi:hypothetical protein
MTFANLFWLEEYHVHKTISIYIVYKNVNKKPPIFLGIGGARGTVNKLGVTGIAK